MDRRYANITIGGHIRADLVDELMEYVECLGFADEETEILDLITDSTGLIHLEDDEAVDAEFVYLEAFLESHGIQFDRYSSQSYEHNASEKKFRPGWPPINIFLDADCEPFIPIGTLSAIVNRASGDMKRLVSMMRAECGMYVPNLEPVTIEGQLLRSGPKMTSDELKTLNMDGRTDCAQCGQKMSEPYAGIRYCRPCEGGK